MLQALSRYLNRGVEVVLVGLGVTMAAVVATQVFARYALNDSLFWSEELARYLLVWLSFLGASSAYYRGVHPGVDILYGRLPPGARRAAAFATHLAALVLFGVMIVYGWQFAHFVRRQISPALHLPKWIPHAILPLSGAILTVHALGFLLRDLRGGGDDR